MPVSVAQGHLASQSEHYVRYRKLSKACWSLLVPISSNNRPALPVPHESKIHRPNDLEGQSICRMARLFVSVSLAIQLCCGTAAACSCNARSGTGTVSTELLKRWLRV